MSLRQRGELALLQEIRRRFSPKGDKVIRSIGDDCAVVASTNAPLLVSTDMLNEGVHFDLSYTSAYCLGFKLISVSVSDIYAMGGHPFAVFLSLGLPSHTSEHFFKGLYEGIDEALSLYGSDLLGGDLCCTIREISLTATVLGTSPKPIYRSGARSGDIVYVTGTLGDSALGMHMLKRMDQTSKERVLQSRDISNIDEDIIKINPTLNIRGKNIVDFLKRHLMPIARDLSPIISNISSMIDISDGLFIDLHRLCEESAVGVRIYEDKLPMTPAMLNIAPFLDIHPLTLATEGGEDYELLFTLPPDVPVPTVEGLQITPIGEITNDGIVFIHYNGEEVAIKPSGYEHFRVGT